MSVPCSKPSLMFHLFRRTSSIHASTLRPREQPGPDFPPSPLTTLLHVRPPCSSSHTPDVPPPHSLCPYCALCIEHTCPESSCPHPFGFPFQRPPLREPSLTATWPAPQSLAHDMLSSGSTPLGTIKAIPAVPPCLARCLAPQEPGHIPSNLTKMHRTP